MKRPRLSRRAVTVALLLLMCVGIVSSVVFGSRVRAAERSADRRAAALEVANDQALTLLSINRRNVAEKVSELLDASTGDFRRQLDGLRGTFESVVEEGEVSSEGEVVEAAVSRSTDKDAVVLLALRAEVTNTETAKPREQAYRIVVELQWADGEWLVSRMEFAS